MVGVSPRLGLKPPDDSRLSSASDSGSDEFGVRLAFGLDRLIPKFYAGQGGVPRFLGYCIRVNVYIDIPLTDPVLRCLGPGLRNRLHDLIIPTIRVRVVIQGVSDEHRRV